LAFTSNDGRKQSLDKQEIDENILEIVASLIKLFYPYLSFFDHIPQTFIIFIQIPFVNQQYYSKHRVMRSKMMDFFNIM